MNVWMICLILYLIGTLLVKVDCTYDCNLDEDLTWEKISVDDSNIIIRNLLISYEFYSLIVKVYKAIKSSQIDS